MSLKPFRILYVDDYPLDRALVRDALLSDTGAFELVEAASRQEFDALLLAQKYDLVLSDFNILGFTGLQVLETVQEHLPGTPVILVTGTGSEEVAAEAIKRGAADYVIKSPSHIRRLPHIIRSALEQKRLREERQWTQQELQESEQRFQLLFEEAPIGYQSLDREGRILLVNEMWTRMLGYSRDEVIAKDFNDFVASSDKQYQMDIFARFLVEGEIRNLEFKLVRKDGSQFIAIFNGVVRRDDRGDFLQTHCTLNDITERKRVEQRLVAQRKDYETIIDAMPSMIWYLDPDGKILRANKATAEMVGLPFDELIGKTTFDLFPKQQAEKFHRDNQEVFNTKKPKLGIIEEYLTAAGENRWAHTDKLPYIDPDGTILGVIIISQDITERREAEEKLRLRGEELRLLTARLAEMEQAERRRLARELHDQVGQSLAVLGFNLSLIRDRMAQSGLEDELSAVDSSMALVDEVTQNIRDVMDDLRPSVLDDYGIFSALSWYADRFTDQTKIKTRVLGESLEPRLAVSIENALFRIVQEALANVARHAQATQVAISLKEDQGEIELVITDDGSGFEETVPQEVGHRRGWGLVNMRERAEAIGGRLSVETIINVGTTIKIKAPRG